MFNRPYLDLDATSAHRLLDPDGRLGSVVGTRVLCLASGGGRQSVAFGLLGARVTVLDLSEDVLERDRQAAAHYGLEVTLVQGDMRDLSRFSPKAFDIVWHPYSITFVPEIGSVFREVVRVLRPGGIYHLQVGNPFTLGMGTYDWTGEGYLMQLPYIDGARIDHPDEPWAYDAESVGRPVPPVREYRHTLSTIVNSLTDNGLRIDHLDEPDRYESIDSDAEPGSWHHFMSIAPPWLYLWASRHDGR